ncbi:formate dehydrogenase accessory sulfurtransferase FdhD [Paraglaciecola chathamensis]|uniref:formate dehydrogenase accessory sulfurtransferase FdhD n=1 Tax=Paraglaciecola chathamensis TaxID=368405 RepID=UPI0027081BD9|nr:formate dehydrogenase accessory sulfurtransferase FdhD [Paraglaciecola chathamensis]MDO6558121.1 formate dehydrogenase accessory sulfurtransferase FdhD [Paraglaciecola chathamensis]
MSRVKTFPITRLLSANAPSFKQEGNSLELEKGLELQKSHERLPIDDQVASEEPLEIWLKHPLKQAGKASLLLTTMRSPGDDIALVKGWLHTSGLLDNDADVQRITHTGSGRVKGSMANQVLVTLHPQSHFDIHSLQSQGGSHIEYVNSGCGVCGQRSIDVLLDKIPAQETQSRTKLNAREVFSLAANLRSQQGVFVLTGGCHGAGLFILGKAHTHQSELVDVREDIGRHNALDKLIGANLSLLMPEKTPKQGAEITAEKPAEKAPEYGVVISSRISFDIVQKAAMANIGMILAMGAPSSLAIELAQECDICIAGFIGQKRINVYTCDHRIV